MRARGEEGHRFGMALAGTISGYAIFLLVVGLLIGIIIFSVNQANTYSGIS